MKSPAPLASLADLRLLTPARVALGRSGASLPTRALLDFTLDHARARDAVHAAFDAEALTKGIGKLGLVSCVVASRAGDRRSYLSRPDLGRRLDPASAERLGQIDGKGIVFKTRKAGDQGIATGRSIDGIKAKRVTQDGGAWLFE